MEPQTKLGECLIRYVRTEDTHTVSTASQIAFKPFPQASTDTHIPQFDKYVADYAGPYQKPSGNLGIQCLLDNHEKLLHK